MAERFTKKCSGRESGQHRYDDVPAKALKCWMSIMVSHRLLSLMSMTRRFSRGISILDNQYSEYFGFTPEEVKAIARYYHAEERYAEICAWYDGYRFGASEIFNPWSVINYFSNGCQPRTFWQSTGSNEIIGEVLAYAGEDVYERLNALLQGESSSSIGRLLRYCRRKLLSWFCSGALCHDG